MVNPIGNKRKRYDDDERSPRKKMIRNTENEDEQVSLSPRMNPLQNKTVRVNRYLKHSFSSVVVSYHGSFALVEVIFCLEFIQMSIV